MVLDQLRYPTEMICVVDGKVDGTFKRALKLAKNALNIDSNDKSSYNTIPKIHSIIQYEKPGNLQ